ncbi:adenosine deaminase [Ixodes scapularis]|uniref:adenosine deaminase n=1 Tax=Ixodes scapularis TaxID=6945 RepID=UPI001A9E7EA5|nr:adenosine deaminase [Ixodes scapularis]XP_040072862.1 adenosine deaminase [Ixodes scapularis]
MELPKYKIQLHGHLETHVRHSTIWDLVQKKKLDLGYKSIEDVVQKTKAEPSSTLANYLKEIANVAKAIRGDRDAVVRIAYEAGVDLAAQGVLYGEMFLGTTTYVGDASGSSLRTAAEVVEAVLEGFAKAEREKDIKLRLVLVIARALPETAEEALNLCYEYRDRGVVGIDACGSIKGMPTAEEGEEVLAPEIIQALKNASQLGVHRTIHAGESGPPSNVARAIEVLGAERIGHGYSAIMENGSTYRLALRRRIHFEVCPTCSYLTGAVKKDQEHPLVRLCKDGASFSISTDGPTLTHTTLEDEYRLALSLGLTPEDIVKSNRSAILASFLPVHEKQELLKKFDELNGISGL